MITRYPSFHHCSTNSPPISLKSSGNLQGHERNDIAKFHASPMQSCQLSENPVLA